MTTLTMLHIFGMEIPDGPVVVAAFVIIFALMFIAVMMLVHRDDQ